MVSAFLGFGPVGLIEQPHSGLWIVLAQTHGAERILGLGFAGHRLEHCIAMVHGGAKVARLETADRRFKRLLEVLRLAKGRYPRIQILV